MAHRSPEICSTKRGGIQPEGRAFDRLSQFGGEITGRAAQADNYRHGKSRPARGSAVPVRYLDKVYPAFPAPISHDPEEVVASRDPAKPVVSLTQTQDANPPIFFKVRRGIVARI